MSLLFLITWHLINSIDMKINGFENIVKPTLLGLAYLSTISFLNGPTSPLNPTIAFGIYIWSLGAYNYKPIKGSDQTAFEINHYGVYVWIYIFGPLVAAIVAGFLIRKFKDIYGTSEGQSQNEEASSVRSVRRVP